MNKHMCYTVSMNNQQININNFKVTRDGQYDVKENLKIKARHEVEQISEKIDYFFTSFGR